MVRHDSTLWQELVDHEVKVSTTYISQSSLISWRLFDVCISYFQSMNQYDLTFDLKINVGHCDLYFMVQWLCLIPWRLFHVWTSLFGIMNQYNLMHDLKVNVGHRDHISWSSDFALYLEDYLIYLHHTFWSMNQYNQTFDLKINVGHCDLYFMVQWLCLLPWRLFHVGTSLFGIMNQYDQHMTSK